MMTSHENPVLVLARSCLPDFVAQGNPCQMFDLWCTEPEEWTLNGEAGIDTTPEQREFALKVLKRFVEVYWVDIDTVTL